MSGKVSESPFVIRQMEIGPMQNFVYLIGSRETQEAAVVDPAWDVPAILEEAEKLNLKITRAFVTHTHFDHVNGLPALLQKTDAKVYVHKEEVKQLKIPASQIVGTQAGFELDLGGFSIRFLHTPGHTIGSQCFEVVGSLVSGDTLFVHNCGRTDLPTGSTEQMYETLQILSKLPGKTILYPGHNYGPAPTSTIEDENKNNPYMRIHNLKEFLETP
jgi:glyoxylase-like metal-dependent hydrolase (beta-lactamase superfamily II)